MDFGHSLPLAFVFYFWQISKGARTTGNRNLAQIQTTCHEAAEFRDDVSTLKPASFLAEPTGIALTVHEDVHTVVLSDQ